MSEHSHRQRLAAHGPGAGSGSGYWQGDYDGPTTDVSVEDQGSVTLFTLNTEAAIDWVRENVVTDGWQWLGVSSFAVDHRFSVPLIDAMREHGLVVE